MITQPLVGRLVGHACVKVLGRHTALHGANAARLERTAHHHDLVGKREHLAHTVEQRNLHHAQAGGIVCSGEALQTLAQKRADGRQLERLETRGILGRGKRPLRQQASVELPGLLRKQVGTEDLSDALIERRPCRQHLARELVKVYAAGTQLLELGGHRRLAGANAPGQKDRQHRRLRYERASNF